MLLRQFRSDYGGMDVYVKQILNSNVHDLFYTNAQVIVSSAHFAPEQAAHPCLGGLQKLREHIRLSIRQRTDNLGKSPPRMGLRVVD